MEILIASLTVAGVVLLLEGGLRLLGFGSPLLYIADERIGYRLAPNQQVHRFGNRIEINEYSMRGEAVTPLPAPSTLRILLLGDSVANGGWWTDQAETLSVMMARQLSHREHHTQIFSDLNPFALSATEVLNASANSWGPRNELAYLQHFGHFGAQVIVVLINTDDLFAKRPSSWVVGRDQNYPASRPRLALTDCISRYLLTRWSKPEIPPSETGDLVELNLEAIRQMIDIARQANSFLLLALTPLQRELAPSGSRDYEIRARERLLALTQAESISYLDFLPIFNAVQRPGQLFRDNIHLSPQGNQLVSQTLSHFLQQHI